MSLMESDVEALLYRVCVDFGLCLTPDTYDELVTQAPDSVDAMTDAIFVAQDESRNRQSGDIRSGACVRCGSLRTAGSAQGTSLRFDD